MIGWRLPAVLGALFLAACSALTSGPQVGAGGTAIAEAPVPESAREVVLTALGLLETGYRFGGKNPEAGLDCSGMVNYVFRTAVQQSVGASAADMAQRGKALAPAQWRAGDLVFFNTRGAAHSHVGIYLGDQRFIHAPSSKGKVRIDRLDTGWFASRLTEVRRYLD